jgi:transaldolase
MRNSRRRTDVVNILNAVYQYTSQHNGEIPASITSNPGMICKSGAKSCQGRVDISEILVSEKKILQSVPVDPLEKSENSSGYQISKLSNGRINVTAPLAENNAVISLSK